MNSKNYHEKQTRKDFSNVDPPIWSVMIPTYNCANYLRESLASVLIQDPGPEIMQIEVVDDCSTKDDPEAVVKELGKGRVKFYRQPKNVGHVRNFNTCIDRAEGKLIHILHGDDSLQYGFYEKMQIPFEDKPQIGAAFCRTVFIDEDSNWISLFELLQPKSGLLDNPLEKIVCGFSGIQCPCIVVQRSVYEKIGGFNSRFKYYGEDWEMWVRIATEYPIWYEVEPLAKYRINSISNTGFSVRSGKNVQEIRMAVDIVETYLSRYMPADEAQKNLDIKRKKSAKSAIRTGVKMLKQGEFQAAQCQIKEAFKFKFTFNLTLGFLLIFYSLKSFARSLCQTEE